LAGGEELMTQWVREAFLHGGALCVFMSFIVIASLRQNPLIWVHDAPPAIRAQIGPIDERTKRQKSMWVIVMFVGLVLIFSRLTVRVVEQYKDGHPGWRVFVSALICFELFNLFDALILDIGLAVFQPRWAMLPGVDMSALRDPKWHVRAFILGSFLGFPFAGIVAGIGWLVHALSSLM
jgi:hypothetical protein